MQARDRAHAHGGAVYWCPSLAESVILSGLSVLRA